MKVEGQLRFLANPLCEKRMELILTQKSANAEIVPEVDPGHQPHDEVSFTYYGAESCQCSKNSMCQSNKCICAISEQKCNASCHEGKKTKCKNN